MAILFEKLFKKKGQSDGLQRFDGALSSFEQSQLDKKLLLQCLKNKPTLFAEFREYITRCLHYNFQDKIALIDEFQNLNQYISYYQESLENQVIVSLDVEQDYRGVSVPVFIMFPLVQCALHHGYHAIEKYPMRVKGKLTGDTIVLEVSNRVNHHIQDQAKTDIIRFFRSRLDYSYGDDYNLIINSNSNIFKASLYLKVKA